MQRGSLKPNRIVFSVGAMFKARQTVVSLSCSGAAVLCALTEKERQWHSIYHLDVVKLKDTVPNAKNWGLIYLLNGPYVTSVVAAWVRRSTIHQSTTHSFLEKYGKLLTGSIRKCGEWNQFMLCALHLGITRQMHGCINWFLLAACSNLFFKLAIKRGKG